MPAPAVAVSNLTKVYDVQTNSGIRGLLRPKCEQVPALNGVSLTIAPGELVAVVGPNGAGKTTLIKMLCGILEPTRGDLRVLGIDPIAQRRQLGLQISAIFGQDSQLYPALPLRLNLRYTARVYRVPKHEIEARIAYMTEVLDLKGIMQKPVGTLSLGQRMRGDIAAALMHKPKLIFLDEPTIGLDFQVQEGLRNFIREVNSNFQTTIVLTSHSADDIAIAHRVIVINEGDVVWDSSMRKLLARAENRKMFRVEPITGQPPTIAGVRPIVADDGWILYQLDLAAGACTTNEFAHALDSRGLQIGTVNTAPLSSILLEMYRK